MPPVGHIKDLIFNRDHWLVVEALLLLVAVVVNVYGVGLDEKLKVGEIIKRTQKVLKTINGMLNASCIHIIHTCIHIIMYFIIS